MRFSAKGFSMAPFIRDGDVITVSPFREKFPGIGIVVAFIHPQFGKLMVHRIVAKKEKCFLIRGDNSADSDGLIPREHILGYVTNVERRGKNVILGLGFERYVIAFLTRIGFLTPLLLSVRKIFRAIVPADSRWRKNKHNGGDNNEALS